MSDMNMTEGLSRRGFMTGVTAAAISSAVAGDAVAADSSTAKPNILLVVADDLGWGELGCYGQQTIRTPVLDGLAAQGQRLTQAYTTPTCAPTRCSLLTGLHSGHARVKKNIDSKVGLLPEDVTVGEVLSSAGYTCAMIGKWGFGPDTGDNPSHPNQQGFDYFFGYIDQRHAHDYWPTYLWRNDTRVEYPENATADVTYSNDLFTAESLAFLERNVDRPFFLSLNYTVPHPPNEMPSDAPYSDMPWPRGERNHAAQITWLDGQVGVVLDKLDELGLAENTWVIVTSDNGPHNEGASYRHVGSTEPHDVNFFDSNGPLRGFKRSLYEGGIRVPMLVRPPYGLVGPAAPGPGSIINDPVVIWDLLPTLAEIAGAQLVVPVDGISIVSLLTRAEAADREYLYWQFSERRFDQAVRFGRWKAVRFDGGPIELYDVRQDIGETQDLAGRHPELVRHAERMMAEAVA